MSTNKATVQLSISTINALSSAFRAELDGRELFRYARVTQAWIWEGGEAAVFLVGDKLWQLVGHRGEYHSARCQGVAQALKQCFGLEAV